MKKVKEVSTEVKEVSNQPKGSAKYLYHKGECRASRIS